MQRRPMPVVMIPGRGVNGKFVDQRNHVRWLTFNEEDLPPRRDHAYITDGQ